MTLGLEDYVQDRPEEMGVVGYTPADVVEIATSAAIEALDCADTLCKALGDGSHFDVRTDPGHSPARWHDRQPSRRRTLLDDIARQMDRGVDWYWQWKRWHDGDFRRAS